jgi:uncharacterized protein YacL
MLRKLVRVSFLIIGFTLGFQLASAGMATLAAFTGIKATAVTGIGFSVFGGTVVGLIGYLISPLFINFAARVNNWVEATLRTIPTQDIVVGVTGLVVGLLIGSLISLSLYNIPIIGSYLAVVVTLFAGYLGTSLMLNRKEDMSFLTGLFTRHQQIKAEKSANNRAAKILDTSVIIDGRIVDIIATGFIEGVIVVPGFVLEELRHIADSSDTLKRNRGRRGLDILNTIQKKSLIPVRIVEQDFEDIPEVDSKLIKLAKVLKGKIVTNDYNLNKVCELQGVPVLNINELANAVKPVVLPGEEMQAQIIKDGKETGQGVAYLDDGTMVVVEGGRRYIGSTIDVTVTSVLQTAAGRMIFAKPKIAEKISEVR